MDLSLSKLCLTFGVLGNVASGIRAAIDGLTTNPLFGTSADDETTVTGTLSGLEGGETIVHRWTANGVVISGATASTLTIDIGTNVADKDSLRYAPTVDGVEVLSSPVTVNHPGTDAVATIEVANGDPWTLPTQNLGVWNLKADMGDGAGWINVNTYNGITATYTTGGIKTIRMRGQAHNINCSESPTDAAKLRTFYLGNLGWQAMIRGFKGATGLTSFTIGASDTSAIDNLAEWFSGCTALQTCDITGHTFPAVTNFRQAFRNCPALTSVPGFNELNFGNVTRADECFEGTTNVTGIDPSNFSILSLTSDGGMFRFIEDTEALDQAVYDALLTNYNAQAIDPGLNSGVQLGFGISPFTTGGAVEAARTNLIGELASLTDGGNDVPEAMAAPSLVVDGSGQITVTRAAAPFDNGRPVTSYNLYQSTDGTNYSLAVTGMSTAQAVTGLLSETQYWFYTTAVNFDGEGPAGAAANATTDAAAGLTIAGIGPQASSGEVPVSYSIGADDPTVEAVLFDSAEADPVASDFNGGGAPTYIDLGTVNLTTAGSSINLTLPDGELGNYKVALLPTGGGDADVAVSGVFALDTTDAVLSAVSFVDGGSTDVDWGFTANEDSATAGYRVSLWADGTNPSDADIASGTGSVATVTGTASSGVAEAGNLGSLAAAIYQPTIYFVDAFGNETYLTEADVTVAAAGITDPNDLSPEIWFDFTRTDGLYTDVARTTNIVNDGDVVRGVDDRSGNARHAFLNWTVSLWEAANTQVDMGADNVQSVEISSVTGLPSNFEVYIALKTTDTVFNLTSGHSFSAYAGRSQASPSTVTDTGMGTPTYSTNNVAFSPTDAADISTEWATGTGLVAGIQALDPTNINGGIFQFLNVVSGYNMLGPITHIVVTPALTAGQRADLQTWLSTRLPV